MESKKDIEKRVYDLYPVTPKEKNCAMEQRKMDYLRNEYRKKLKQTHISKRKFGE